MIVPLLLTDLLYSDSILNLCYTAVLSTKYAAHNNPFRVKAKICDRSFISFTSSGCGRHITC